jgi:Alpha/beta hydrolase of unknown function (DUF900)
MNEVPQATMGEDHPTGNNINVEMKEDHHDDSHTNGKNNRSLRNRKLSQRTKSKKWKWAYRIPPNLSKAQETTFLNMQLRKNNRALTGTKHRNTNYEFAVLLVFLVIIYSVGTQEATSTTNQEHNPYFVTLTFQQVVTTGIWLFLATFITSTFRESRFIVLLFWMLVYLPLMAMILILFTDDKFLQTGNLNVFSYAQVIGISLLITEVLALLIFVTVYYFYPKWINSARFRRQSTAATFFRIQLLDDWTITYRGPKGWLRHRNSCKYQGETNRDGLPHGVGEWFDDAYDGEILSGHWRNGVPIAPFMARHYGRGDAFSAVRIAYIMASDDEFHTNKFWPTNKKSPRCGIGGVECSVSGSFYNELPCSSVLIDAGIFDETSSVEELLNNLIHLGEGADRNVIHINANDPRGVQISGHVHAATGEHLNVVDEIRITVKPESSVPVHDRFQRSPKLMRYMPVSYGHFPRAERLVVRNELLADDSEEECVEVSSSILPPVRLSELVDDEREEIEGVEAGAALVPKTEQTKVTINVEGWKPARHKDALVFIGGFNCALKEGLQNLGQFMAMTKLDAHVYPILFAWPVGTVPTYFSASIVSHSHQNKKNFLAMLKGLQHAGIRNVHFMSHSMGAQTLLTSFVDKPDGSRSDVSRCFRLASDCDEEDDGTYPPASDIHGRKSEDQTDDSLLICKTITLLNPDFPVSPFVNHTFRSVRRICSTITVVGDRSDGALFFSELLNGIGLYFGYKQPDALQPNNYNKEHLRFCRTIGKRIEDLHFAKVTPTTPDDSIRKTAGTSAGTPSYCRGNSSSESYLLFSERAPITLVSQEEELEKAWLDLDVIDTTGLDTNIANIRHNAFLLNPILLKDLDEIIRTGQRAMKRSSLLYRDGNLFSYCHAPSFVTS